MLQLVCRALSTDRQPGVCVCVCVCVCALLSQPPVTPEPSVLDRQPSMSLAVQMLDSIVADLADQQLVPDEWVASVYANCAASLRHRAGPCQGSSQLNLVLYVAVSDLCDHTPTLHEREAGLTAVRTAPGLCRTA